MVCMHFESVNLVFNSTLYHKRTWLEHTTWSQLLLMFNCGNIPKREKINCFNDGTRVYFHFAKFCAKQKEN